MTARFAIRPVILSAALTLFGAAALAQAPGFAGHWEGTIQYGSPPLAVSVDLSKNAAGAWIGSFSAIGSTTADVPLAGIAVTDQSVKFTLSLPDNPAFEGRLSADGATFSGTASNSQGSAPFELKRSGEAHVSVPPPSSALPAEFAGRWEGAVDVGGTRLRIALKLSTGADGKASASLVSIDQGAQEFPATSVNIEGRKLNVEVRIISGTYNGVLGDDAKITGTWTQGGTSLALVLAKAP